MKELKFENMHPLIKQPYKLTMSGTTFNRQQQRILLRCLQVLQPLIIEGGKDLLTKPGSTLLIPKEDQAIGSASYNAVGDLDINLVTKSVLLKKTDSRKVLRNNLKALKKQTIHFWKKDDNGQIIEEGFVGLASVTKIDYRATNIYIRVDRHAIPYFLDYANYTRVNPKVAFKISSTLMAKMYEVICQFRDKPETDVISLEQLKKTLMIEGKYKHPRHVKQWILEPAMKEFEKNADVWFDIAERVMDGRKFIGWRFKIYTRDNEAAKNEKKKADEAKNSELASLSQIELSEKKRKALEVLKKIEEQEKENSYENAVERLKSELKLSHWQAEKLAIDAIDSKNEKLREFLKKLIQIVKGGKIRNPGGFVVKQLYAEFGIKLCKSVTKHEHEEQ